MKNSLNTLKQQYVRVTTLHCFSISVLLRFRPYFVMFKNITYFLTNKKKNILSVGEIKIDNTNTV